MPLRGPIRRRLKGLAGRLGLLEAPPPPVERGPEYYDAAYRAVAEYQLDYPQSRYYVVWSVIVDRIRRHGLRKVLEVGCGSGQLARYLVDQGVEEYVGFDFSAAAIDMAREAAPGRARFECADARTTGLFTSWRYEAIVCTEVLEHVEEDLELVTRFPAGIRCFCTVPDFPYESHVRHFDGPEAVAARYGPFFDSLDVAVLRRPDAATGRYFLFEGVRNGRPA